MIKNILCPSQEILSQIAQKHGTPVFVTDERILRARAQELITAFPSPKKVLYAIKANPNPAIVKILLEEGIDGIDAVSVNEVRLAIELGVPRENIVFTGSNPSQEEIEYVMNEKVLINAGSLSEIERIGKNFPGHHIAIRINPGFGAGMHEKVTTGGERSKFGIPFVQFEDAKVLLKKYNLHLKGIHSHIGSGFYDSHEFVSEAKMILEEAESFTDLEFVDFGGGFGIPYAPHQHHLDLQTFGEDISHVLNEFSQKNGREIEMRIEPGRYLVAESTTLLTQVTTRKECHHQVFIGLNTGMNHLIRPAMYDSYHHILNISQPQNPIETVHVAGNICESSDFFARDYALPRAQEGDLIAICDTGAYGSSMSSNYNFFPLAAEVLTDGKNITLTKKRQSYQQIIENYIF